MKKTIKRIIILFIIITLLELIVLMFKKEHDITYELTLNNLKYQIHEIFKNKMYNFEINIDNNYFVFETENNYYKKKKVINEIYYYDTEDIKCIYTSTEEDIVCLNNGILQSYYESSKYIEPFIKQLKEKGYNNPNWEKTDSRIKTIGPVEIYQDNILEDSYIYLWKYNGFYSITNKKLQKVDVFSNDTYVNKLGVLVDKYYLIPNYDEKYDFKTMYVYNITNNKKKKIELKKSISHDSYINGIVENKVYLTDTDNLIQYEINPKKRKINEVGNTNDGGLIYENNKFKYINIYEFRKKEIKYEQDYSDIIENTTYINKVNDTYYYEKDGKFYKYNKEFEVSTLLFKKDASNITMAKEDIYFINDNILYLYDGTLKQILKYDELSFNSTNRYAVYKK